MRPVALAMSIVFLASCVSGTTTSVPTLSPEPSPTRSIEPSAPPSAAASAAPAETPDPVLFQAIDFVSRTTGWVAMEDAGGRALFRTTDGGDHWERLALARGTTHQIKFVDANTGWLLGSVDDPAGCLAGNCSEAVLRTLDGGRTWEQELVSARSFGQLSVVDASHAWVVQPGPACGFDWDSCTSQILATSNATTWRPLAMVNGQTTSLGFVDAATGWLTVRTLTDASILVTHDGGSSWARQFHASGSSPLLQVSFANTRDGWALGSDISFCAMGGCGGYTLYATTDGGATWTSLQRPEREDWWGPIPRDAPAGGFLGAPQFTSPASGWIGIHTGAGGGTGGVLVTADGGRTWRRSPGDAGTWSVAALAPVDAKIAFAMVHAYEGSTGTTFLARTIDGALTWQRLPLTEPFPVTLPSGCRILSTVLGTDQLQWRIDCGAAMNASARGSLAPALSADGWRLCGSGLGSATWSKAGSLLGIAEGSGVPGEGFVVSLRSGGPLANC